MSDYKVEVRYIFCYTPGSLPIRLRKSPHQGWNAVSLEMCVMLILQGRLFVCKKIENDFTDFYRDCQSVEKITMKDMSLFE